MRHPNLASAVSRAEACVLPFFLFSTTCAAASGSWVPFARLSSPHAAAALFYEGHNGAGWIVRGVVLMEQHEGLWDDVGRPTIEIPPVEDSACLSPSPWGDCRRCNSTSPVSFSSCKQTYRRKAAGTVHCRDTSIAGIRETGPGFHMRIKK